MTINIDDDPEEADWPKRSWDLPTDPKHFTEEQLRLLPSLPVWRAAPPDVKRAALALTEGERGQG